MAWTHWRVLHLVPVEVTFYDSIYFYMRYHEISWGYMTIYDSMTMTLCGILRLELWFDSGSTVTYRSKYVRFQGQATGTPPTRCPKARQISSQGPAISTAEKRWKTRKLCTLWLNYDRLWHISQDPKPQDPARPHKPDRDLSSRVTIWTFSPSWVDASEISSHVCHVQCDQSS
jgi:hypothetical protein